MKCRMLFVGLILLVLSGFAFAEDNYYLRGLWSLPSSWSLNKVPDMNDVVHLNGVVTIEDSEVASVSGVIVADMSNTIFFVKGVLYSEEPIFQGSGFSSHINVSRGGHISTPAFIGGSLALQEGSIQTETISCPIQITDGYVYGLDWSTDFYDLAVLAENWLKEPSF